MDVKTGSGAFAAGIEQARELAASIVSVAQGAGLRCTALITDQNQVLGDRAGNALEVGEALDYLCGRRRDARIHELVLEDIEISKPQRNEVLIRTSASGLCHSDLHFVDGIYPFKAPAVLGHESAGVVEAVGEDVHYVEPGDHVITCLSAFCGT